MPRPAPVGLESMVLLPMPADERWNWRGSAPWLLAWMLALPRLETDAIVMLASLPVGANVYLMSRQFNTLGGPVAASLVLSTALAAVTTPLILALIGSAPN